MGVNNTGGREKGGEGRKTENMYLSCGDFVVQLLNFVS